MSCIRLGARRNVVFHASFSPQPNPPLPSLPCHLRTFFRVFLSFFSHSPAVLVWEYWRKEKKKGGESPLLPPARPPANANPAVLQPV